MTTNRPFDFLNDSIGKPVLIELKGNNSIRGTLKAFDIHINTVLDDAEELEENQVKRKIGKVFLRGDTIILISPTE